MLARTVKRLQATQACTKQSGAVKWEELLYKFVYFLRVLCQIQMLYIAYANKNSVAAAVAAAAAAAAEASHQFLSV